MSRNRTPTTLYSPTSQAAASTMAETQRVPLLAPLHSLDQPYRQPPQPIRLPPLRIQLPHPAGQLARDPLLPPPIQSFRSNASIPGVTSPPLDSIRRPRTSRSAAPLSDLLSSQTTTPPSDANRSPNYDLRRSPQPEDDRQTDPGRGVRRYSVSQHSVGETEAKPSNIPSFGALQLQHHAEIPSTLSRRTYDARIPEQADHGIVRHDHFGAPSSAVRDANRDVIHITGHEGAQRGTSNMPSPQCELRIRQQPIAARACGFGERDRRVIDPPPILQLVTRDLSTGSVDLDELRNSLHIVHCTLWSADGSTEETALRQPDRRTTRRLMGQLVASPSVARDENDVEGCFFCFPDLSCRTHGQYRLKFILIRLDPENMSVGSFSPILTEVLTNVFTVYTAKDFPGMQPSSALTRALKLQGCNIQVKKGNERTITRKRKSFNEIDEGAESNDGAASLKRHKDSG